MNSMHVFPAVPHRADFILSKEGELPSRGAGKPPLVGRQCLRRILALEATRVHGARRFFFGALSFLLTLTT
jgi:hypothetical protein